MLWAMPDPEIQRSVRPATPEELFARLEALGIETQTHHHEPLFTVDESKRLRGLIPGGHCKSLFLKAKKGGLWLVVTLEDRKLDLKALARRLGAGALSFGKPALLMEVLGVPPGAVTPFALINDASLRVKVVLDKEMMALDLVNYHPLTNEATTTIRPEDLLAFIAACGHEPVIIDFGLIMAAARS